MDWKGLGLLDYPLVVTKPMDLGTIKVGARSNLVCLGEVRGGSSLTSEELT